MMLCDGQPSKPRQRAAGFARFALIIGDIVILPLISVASGAYILLNTRLVNYRRTFRAASASAKKSPIDGTRQPGSRSRRAVNIFIDKSHQSILKGDVIARRFAALHAEEGDYLHHGASPLSAAS